MIGVRLGGPDRASIRYLRTWTNGFYISPLVNNFDSDLLRFLVKQYFENGAALFGRESPEGLQLVRDRSSGRLDSVSDRHVYLICQYFVQRIRNYCHVESLAGGEIWKARSDEWCHPVRDVNIADAKSRIVWLKSLSMFDYGVLAYGTDFGFPPFSLECGCRIEGIIPGAENA